jgi:hypothetical protein
MSRDRYHASDDDNERAGPSMPRGVIRARGGWKGEELELEHQLETSGERNVSTAAAVDLDQFRNTVVGKGYQAKHVIRQATAAPVVTIKDMSALQKSQVAESSNKKRKQRDQPKKEKNPVTRYLQSSVLRRFRRELAKIESKR